LDVAAGHVRQFGQLVLGGGGEPRRPRSLILKLGQDAGRNSILGIFRELCYLSEGPL
jgi:hypothetical protein